MYYVHKECDLTIVYTREVLVKSNFQKSRPDYYSHFELGKSFSGYTLDELHAWSYHNCDTHLIQPHELATYKAYTTEQFKAYLETREL